jgi:hypothetical protein
MQCNADPDYFNFGTSKKKRRGKIYNCLSYFFVAFQFHKNKIILKDLKKFD